MQSNSRLYYSPHPRGLPDRPVRGRSSVPWPKIQAALYEPNTHHLQTIFNPGIHSLSSPCHSTTERTTNHMAKINLNKLFDELRGKIGNLVFRRRPDGTLIVSSK